MKVVLKQDVKSIGKKDEMYEVSDGYARNYLIPRGLAMVADTAAMNEVKAKADSKKHKEDLEREAALELADKIKDQRVSVHAKGGESGRLFGAVTVKDISAALLAEKGVEIDKRKLNLDVREIKDYGSYTVEAKIAPGISAKFTCEVVKE